MARYVHLVLVLVFAIGASAHAQEQDLELHVDGDVSGGNGSGDSWANAYGSLEEALADASSEIDGNPEVDVVWIYVAATSNPYVPDGGTGNEALSFEVTPGVSVFGGFDPAFDPNGDGVATRNERDVKRRETVLSGDITGDENSRNVVRMLNTPGAELARVDGFTIEHGEGFFSGGGNAFGGGGVNARADIDFVLGNCELRHNSAGDQAAGDEGWGGALIVSGATARASTIRGHVLSCVFWGNTAKRGGAGGAAYADAFATVEFVNCLLFDNAAVVSSGGASGRGGAIFVTQSALVQIVNCTIADNVATGASSKGGGIFSAADRANVTDIDNCIVYFNSANADPQIGGDNVSISSSNVEGEQGADDPDFRDRSGDDYRLEYSSPSVDAGSNGALPADDYNLDDDADDTEAPPDAERKDRIQVSPVDQGAYETCDADADFDDDGYVDFNDLLPLLSKWGDCPDPRDPCPWDLDGDDVVGFDDLLTLLDAWCVGDPGLDADEALACMGIEDTCWAQMMSTLDTGSAAAQSDVICWIEHYWYIHCQCMGTCFDNTPTGCGDDPCGIH